MTGLTGQMAMHAANARAEGMLAPLLGEEEEDDVYSAADEETVISDNEYSAKKSALKKIKTAFVYGVLIAGVGASAVSFAFAPHTLVFIAGGLYIAHSPFSAYKEYKMGKIQSLRSMNNKLRELAIRLEGEVEVLSEEINGLQPEVERSKIMEEELRTVASGQKVNVDHLIDLVKQNHTILDRMWENVRQRVVQDVIRIVMKSDKNNDGRFDKAEAKMLALQIRIQLQEYGVELDEQKFFNIMSTNPTVPRVIGIVQKLIPDDRSHARDRKKRGEICDESDTAEVESDEDDDYDMFHMSSSIASLSGSLVGLTSSSVFDDGRFSLSRANSPDFIHGKRKSLAVP